MGEDYKLELIDDLGEDDYTVYTNGGFADLCRGPHVARTGMLKAFKLLSVAGAYWRGDEKNKQLQRIYGTAWNDPKALKKHLHRLEEAKKRDHRKLGTQLDLFSFNEEVGPGMALWHPARHAHPGHPGGLRAKGAPQARLRPGPGAADPQGASCGRSPATTTTTARTCISRRSMSRPTGSSP